MLACSGVHLKMRRSARWHGPSPVHGRSVHAEHSLVCIGRPRQDEIVEAVSVVSDDPDADHGAANDAERRLRINDQGKAK